MTNLDVTPSLMSARMIFSTVSSARIMLDEKNVVSSFSRTLYFE